jgi:prevent-host-death family protein
MILPFSAGVTIVSPLVGRQFAAQSRFTTVAVDFAARILRLPQRGFQECLIAWTFGGFLGIGVALGQPGQVNYEQGDQESGEVEMQVNMLEAKNQLSKLVKAAVSSEKVIIASNGGPRVRLVPCESPAGLRHWGALAGQFADTDQAFGEAVDAEVGTLFGVPCD